MNTFKKYILLLLTAPVFLLTACEKSFENFTPYPGNNTDTVWASASTGSFAGITQLHENLVRVPLTDSFNLAVASTLNLAGDIHLEIPARIFQTATGTVADGQAQIQVLLLKTKGELIRFQKQTVSNGYLLESGGVLFVQVTKNGTALALRPGSTFRVTFRDSIPNSQMRGFIGVEPSGTNGLTNFNWVRSDSLSVRTIQSPAGYDLTINNMRWINCDYFKDTADIKSRIALSMPVMFTNGNTSTWIVYKNIRSVMQMDADFANRIWRKERVPINKEVIFVTVSKVGNDYWLGTKDAVTALNQNIEIRPVQKSLQDIKNFLDGL